MFKGQKYLISKICIILFPLLIYKEWKKRVQAHISVKAILNWVSINIFQKWLRHSSIFITSIYTDVTRMDKNHFMSRIQ
jgi:hypothetical protein